MAARGRGQQKDAAAPAEGDPLAAHYGDAPMVQSRAVTGRKWTDLAALSTDLVGQKVGLHAPNQNLCL